MLGETLEVDLVKPGKDEGAGGWLSRGRIDGRGEWRTAADLGST